MQNVNFVSLQVCILSCLRPPISREVYDALVKSADVGQILSLLHEAQQQNVPLVQLPSSLSHLDHPTRNVGYCCLDYFLDEC